MIIESQQKQDYLQKRQQEIAAVSIDPFLKLEDENGNFFIADVDGVFSGSSYVFYSVSHADILNIQTFLKKGAEYYLSIKICQRDKMTLINNLSFPTNTSPEAITEEVRRISAYLHHLLMASRNPGYLKSSCPSK